MIKCSNCNEVSGIVKAGKQNYVQRYFCKYCKKYFTIKVDEQKKTKTKEGITIKDIAQKLGLGISTISRALNSSDEIKKKPKKLFLRPQNQWAMKKTLQQ